MTSPERRSDNLQWTKAVTEAFGEIKDCVEELNTTVLKHTEERRKTKVWIAILSGVVGLFLVIEGVSLYESRQARQQIVDCTTADGTCFQRNLSRSQDRLTEAITEVVCADARDTRRILQPIINETIPNISVPKLPEECIEQ